MSLSSENMMKLMAYADGELEGADEAEIQKLLAKEPDAARFVEQIAGLGDFVKAGHEDKSKTFDVADLVMAKIKDDAPTPAKVVSLADARKKRTQVTVAVVVAALALAASIFLFKKPEETPMAKGPAPTASPAAPVNEGEEIAPGVEVTAAVESPGQSVKVFYGPGTNEMTTSVVIWVEEK